MTPNERLLRRRIRARVARLEPPLRRAILEAFDSIARDLSVTEIEAFIQAGALDSILSDEFLDQHFAPLRASYQSAARDAAFLMAKDVPGIGTNPGAVFDVLNPRVIDAVQKLDTKVIRTLKDSIRETVRDHIQAGLEAGKGPLAVARGVRSTIGMAPNQEAAVANFRAMLESGSRTALTRKLRDRRFDRTLAKALGKDGTGLSRDQVDRMVDAYRRRMIAFNAETNARTASLDALKEGQRLGWSEAVANGYVDGGRLMKRWRTNMDGRERPEHAAMNGEEVPWDAQFPNGETVPGESTYSCRCLAFYFQARGGPETT